MAIKAVVIVTDITAGQYSTFYANVKYAFMDDLSESSGTYDNLGPYAPDVAASSIAADVASLLSITAPDEVRVLNFVS